MCMCLYSRLDIMRLVCIYMYVRPLAVYIHSTRKQKRIKFLFWNRQHSLRKFGWVLTRGVRQSSLSFLREACSTESSIWMSNNSGVTGPTTSVISRNWVLKIEIFARAEWVKAGESFSTVKRWRSGDGYRQACSRRGFNSFSRWFFFFNSYTFLIIYNVISISFDYL